MSFPKSVFCFELYQGSDFKWIFRPYHNTQTDKNFKINTYPDLNNGILSVEFEQNVLQNYELYLIDGQGKVIYSLKSIQESKIEINITGFSKGNYVLLVRDTKNRNASVNKIIFQ